MASYSDIKRMLNDKGVESEKVDFHAFYDRKLTRHENMVNFATMHGVGVSQTHRAQTGQYHDTRQIGTTHRKVDGQRQAQPPGYRKGPRGSPGYYERRKNRTDVYQPKPGVRKRKKGSWW